MHSNHQHSSFYQLLQCLTIVTLTALTVLTVPIGVVDSFSVAPPSLLTTRHSLSSVASTTLASPVASTASTDQTALATTTRTSLFMSTEATESLTTTNNDNKEEEEDDDEEEWIEEEFESLTERDFYNSEWKVGTVMDKRPNEIVETWARLVCTEEGENQAVWGDGSKGKWTVDVPTQYFSISKESIGGWGGKKIWACNIDDYYFLEGTVRGWSPLQPASVLGQWQAIRLGCKEEERGVAPWFMEEEEEENEEENEAGEGEGEGEGEAMVEGDDGKDSVSM